MTRPLWGWVATKTERVELERLPITLGQLLKWLGVVRTGGQVKDMLAGGEVRVNGTAERRRGRKLYAGDLLELPDGRRVHIASPPGRDGGGHAG